MQNFVYVVTLLGLIGIPSIFSMTVWCIKACKGFSHRLTVMEEGIKSSMRAGLIKEYEKYIANGFIPDVAMQEWQNQYNAYTQLKGKNGVLEDRYERLLKLPSNVDDE